MYSMSDGLIMIVLLLLISGQYEGFFASAKAAQQPARIKIVAKHKKPLLNDKILSMN